VRFKDGKPQSIEPVIGGFLVKAGESEYGYFGRPFGLAQGKDGSLFIGDDANGVIYRVRHAEAKTAEAGPDVPKEAMMNAALSAQDTPKRLAGELLEADSGLQAE